MRITISLTLDGVLPLDAYILAMELAIFEALKDVQQAQIPPEPEKGRLLPFGESCYAFFEPDQIARFRSLGLKVDEDEPMYGPLEE